jgi:serine/threonine protein kinase
MARVVPLGQPANDAEKRALAYLRDHLPDSYVLLHNFELVKNRELFEIDLALLTPHSVFLVDIKGTHGQIEVYGAKWQPEGRQSFHSPLAKLRDHARVFKDWICDAHPERPELRRVHVHAAVLMTAPNANVNDPSGRDGKDVVYFKNCLAYFQGKSHISTNRDTNIVPSLKLIESVVRGKAQPSKTPLRFHEWQVQEKLGSGARYTEYRARHELIRERERTVRLRVYRVDPLLDREEYAAQQNLISNAFQALFRLPTHPNLVAVHDFFGTDDNDAFVLVIEDVAGVALRQVFNKREWVRTFDQKMRIIQELLAVLAHAHTHGVIHRNLTPDAVLIGADGVTRLTAFEYARVGENRANTIADDITDDLDPAYQAPECFRNPAAATTASDLFAAGFLIHELLTGKAVLVDYQAQQTVLDEALAALYPDLAPGLSIWLQALCAYDITKRQASANSALQQLQAILQARSVPPAIVSSEPISQPATAPPNLRNLPTNYRLGERFIVQKRLGEGKFGVVYKVFDSYGDVDRVLKLVTYDRHSVLERLRQEYRPLAKLPDHPNVVKVIWADRLPDLDDTPYIVMEYADGLTVQEFIDAQALALEDARMIARQVALGLAHIHRYGCYHQDIKPSNLLWTNQGIRIIDFNVAVSDEEQRAQGGTLRYLPPDFEPSDKPTTAEKVDRDLYALGITFYQCVTGQYPFEEPADALRNLPRNPRQFAGLENLSDEWVQLIYRMIDRQRVRRFASADDLRKALDALPPLQRKRDSTSSTFLTSDNSQSALPALLQNTRPNFNPFVSHLLTLYSQSRKTNAGTRGLDAIGKLTYIPTRLDTQLRSAVLNGDFRLVIISGNAGDGKTAFIQQLEEQAKAQGGIIQRSLNGATFTLGERTFYSNYDGSQDEGDKANDQVLRDFLAPFAGNDARRWPTTETWLIAINEGRLVDFLITHKERFPLLRQLVRQGLSGNDAQDGVIVINLNLRAVVADIEGPNSSIFDRFLQRLLEPHFWQACAGCNLRNRCYVYHNVHTLMDPVAGPKVIERLKTLYTATHLRNRLHITLRDLRSALAYTLVGTRDCDEIHALYEGAEARQEILDGFYFNAWAGGTHKSQDRLLQLLSEIDVGLTSNPELDRAFDFRDPQHPELSRFSFQERSGYDDALFAAQFKQLPREINRTSPATVFAAHQGYIQMLRRRYYFERRERERSERTRETAMLPYRTVDRFLALVNGNIAIASEVEQILHAINRGEGLSAPARLGAQLALRVRQVERGSVRSYRLFDGNRFQLLKPKAADHHPFIEHLAQALVLSYTVLGGRPAELHINLDVYEMLNRLNEGYRPNVEEIQGFYRTLAVFKNVLAAAPYQEVLLTESGYEFFRMQRTNAGVLKLARVAEEQERI